MIVGIVACGKNWEIGKKNGLLFKLPEDMKYFRQQTEHNIVVMGYNTLLSLPGGKPLKNRVTYVLCPDGIEPDGCVVYHDFNKLVHDLQVLSAEFVVYICGGAMLYKSMMPYYDRLLVNKVDAEDKEATAFFEDIDSNQDYQLLFKNNSIIDNGYSTTLCVYDRRSDA